MFPTPGDLTQDQTLIFAILAAAIVLFVWGRWRHDIVAGSALIACVLAGLVPAGEAFSGFGHPAVITVACVLILSRALQDSGAVDVLTRTAVPTRTGPLLSMAALTGLAAVLSAFMNNVGALALLLPVAIQMANRCDLPPGLMLMPLAFGSILGGMTTMIGTPPNLIVSGFRLQETGSGFGMFDFTPVGAAIAITGIAFIVLVGWRLVPRRERGGTEGFDTGTYFTEATVPDKSKAIGMTLRQVEDELEEAGAQVIGLVRDEVRMAAPHPRRTVSAGDVLVIEADPESLASALSSLDLRLSEDRREEEGGKQDNGIDEAEAPSDADTDDEDAGNDDERSAGADDVTLAEFTILPGSALIARSAADIHLRARHGINLLAISRHGKRSISRLRSARLAAGDVILLQGTPEDLHEFANLFGCAPLAERALHLPRPREALIAGGIMLVTVAAAAFGLLPAAIAFSGGVLAAMMLSVVSPRTVYNAVDWPVIILLGALIPVAGAMASTGAAELISKSLLDWAARGDPVLAIAIILIVTMILTDFMNNAATAVTMCPIAIGTASMLGANPDAFLMAVAVGASCAFLTPIGHQNNTLILGPGGFRFGDYWRLGLPLEILVIAVGVPMILLVWPL